MNTIVEVCRETNQDRPSTAAPACRNGHRGHKNPIWGKAAMVIAAGTTWATCAVLLTNQLIAQIR